VDTASGHTGTDIFTVTTGDGDTSGGHGGECSGGGKCKNEECNKGSGLDMDESCSGVMRAWALSLKTKTFCSNILGFRAKALAYK